MIKSAFIFLWTLAIAGPASGSCPINTLNVCGTGMDSSLPVDERVCSTPCTIIGCWI